MKSPKGYIIILGKNIFVIILLIIKYVDVKKYK